MNRLSSRSIVFSAALALAMCGVTASQANDVPPTADGSTMSTAADTSFVKTASAAGLAEVSLGKLAATKGQSDATKAFGQTMVDDHTKAGDELKNLASTKSIPVSTAPMPADADAATAIGEKQGAEFDAAFKAKMVADHEKVIKLFSNEASSGKDRDLKAFAAKTLPTLQHHLEMAKQLPSGR
jgi:putative membrane protein